MKKSLLSLLCVALLLAVPACKKEGSRDGGMKKEKSAKMHHHADKKSKKVKKDKKMKASKKKAHKGARKMKDGAEMVVEAAHQ